MALALLAPCPPFELPGTDGASHTLASMSGDVLVVLVSCNHCPYVVAYEPRVVAMAEEYGPKGVAWLAVNANDAARYPEDAMQPMKERASARRFPFVYVRDDTQAFVRSLGARFTPEVFVFDRARTLRYHGRIDDNHRDLARVTSHDLRDALDGLLAGTDLKTTETTPFGCSVKWK